MSPESSTADAPAVGDDVERFFFVHVQKSAGTSLFKRLRKLFGRAAVYPDETDGDVFTDAPQITPEQLVARWPVRRHQLRVVTGHLPLCTRELVDADFTTLTVLRDPLERTLSYLRHHRMLVPEDRDLPLEEIYDDPFRFSVIIQNHMVKMFGMRREEMTSGMLTHLRFDRGHLERACEQLATVDVVGLQEHFDDFCLDLEERFGWDLGKKVYANVTEPAAAPDSLIERIRTDNALDFELYDYARSLVAERAAARPVRGT